jgi:Zn-dependent M32 family carboxypeptidase
MLRDRFVSPQVQILLDRMESHPEEFCKSLSITQALYNEKWDTVLSAGEFNLVEKYLIKRKIKGLRRKITHQQILMTIMYGENLQERESGPAMSTTSRFQSKLDKALQNKKMIISHDMLKELVKGGK